MSYAEIKKGINSDFLNEPLDAKIDRVEADTQDIQTKVNAIISNRQIKLSSSVSGVLNDYLTLLEIEGKGSVGFIFTKWLNSQSTDDKRILIRLTIDDVIVYWGGYNHVTGTGNQIGIIFSKPNRLISATTIYRTTVLHSPTIETVNGTNSILRYLIDGSSIGASTIPITSYNIENPYIFSKNLKIEVFISGTNNTLTLENIIDYSVE